MFLKCKIFDLLNLKKCFQTIKLFDIYYESYQNIFDKNEKRNLAQIMTNIMYKRVRYDLEAPYFTQSYRFEINCIFKQIKIAKLILDRMVNALLIYQPFIYIVNILQNI